MSATTDGNAALERNHFVTVMTLTQALLAAVAAETACIIFLFGILMAKNKFQDERLAKCEADREGLHNKCTKLQTEVTEVWKSLAHAGIEKLKGSSQ